MLESWATTVLLGLGTLENKVNLMKESTSTRYKTPKEKSLGFLRPDLLEEWDYSRNTFNPFEIHVHTKKIAHWVCSLGHTWSCQVRVRTRDGGGCRYCSHFDAWPGFNDLESLRPDVARLWDHTKNKGLSPSTVTKASNRKVWWVCDKDHNHKWEAKIGHMTDGLRGCPYCSGRKVLEGYNDIYHLYPGLITEWDYDKNTVLPTEVSRGTDIKVWWKCSNGHSTYSKINDRVIRGYGCSVCSPKVSSGEDEVHAFLLEIGIDNIVRNTNKVIKPKQLDIYLPDRNIAIEFNGIFWHSAYHSKDSHSTKTNLCNDLGIQLIHIWEDDWNFKRPIVKRLLKHKLGIKDEVTVFARKTAVRSMSKTDAKYFFDENHLLGFVPGSYYLALENTSGSVAAMILTRRGDTLTLNRYATSCNVPGGHSKLVSWVENNIKYKTMITFADLTISTGDLYEKTGWTKDKVLKPDYMYVIRNKRVHKFNYRKDRFKKDPLLKYDPSMTETELASLNNILRIWDCGKIRYIKERPT